MHAHRNRYRIAMMCRHLNVSKAGYYAWRGRKPSQRRRADAALLKRIRRIHKKSRGSYGRPRIYAELRSKGVRVAGARITRLMRAAGIRGKKRNRSKASSSSPGVLPAAPNLLDRQFNVPRRNQAWVTDISEFPTKEGWLYLAVVLDCFSRRVVGFALDKRKDAALALSALKMALKQRPFDNLLVHSDRGTQFASGDYGRLLELCGVAPSMSRKANCWDNAVMESFFASIKVELEPEKMWKNRAQARAAITDYIQGWYNPKRRHSANGYLSPIQYEKRCVT